MPYRQRCCVPYCDSSEAKIHHTFPNPSKDKNRFLKWLEAVNSNELVNLDERFIYTNKRVCHKHFEQCYVSAISNKRLQAHAVPSLFLPLNVLGEHNYSQPSIFEIGDVLEGPRHQEETDDVVLDHSYAQPTTSQIRDVSENRRHQQETQDLDLLDNITKEISEVEQNRQDITGAVEDILSPYKILKQSGTTKATATHATKTLYSAIQNLYKKYRRERITKQSFKRRLLEAKKYGKKHHLENQLSHLNQMAAMLIRCQFRECKKSKKLRRFTLNEKFLALTLYKQSPKSYSVLSKIFILPSKSTLNKLLSNIVGGPGLHKFVFESLKEMAQEMTSSEKYVALLFDEMAIMPGLHFNEHHGIIQGFEDLGNNERSVYIADHVLLFMVRGLKRNWKAPISYHFCSRGGAKTFQIKNLLTLILKKLIEIDLKPITVICDQNNTAVINSLIKDTRSQYLRTGKVDQYRTGSIEIDNFRIYPIYDPPHLLKGMRNNLLNKDLLYYQKNIPKTAKWIHIQKLYETDRANIDGLRVLPHITDEHIYDNKIRKMKVKHAAQIFSQRFAATLQLASNMDTQRRIGENIGDTAQLLLFFDRLFDSLNGSQKLSDHGKTLRCGLSDRSDHLQFWSKEALPLLGSMRFVKRRPKDQGLPPSLKHWAFCINNIKCIWQILKSEGFSYLLTRRLNQDPLENTFGHLRSFGALNTNPTSSQFAGVFKTLFFKTALSFYKGTFNCEDDKCENMFTSLQKLLVTDHATDPLQTEDSDDVNYSNEKPTLQLSLHQKLHNLSTSYVAGFILKKIKKNVTCIDCKSVMFSDNYESVQNQLISSREYGGGWGRRLCYPTPSFVTCFHDIFKIVNFHLNRKPYSACLVHQLQTVVNSEINFGFLTCNRDHHKSNIIKCIIKFTFRILLHNWCTTVNKILQGKSESYSGNSIVKLEAKKMHLNRVKKRNIKKPQHTLAESV